MARQLPLKLRGSRKGDLRAQFAALCYRVKKGKLQVLVITSRGTKRWIMPKGWPMGGKTPQAAALQEAWEEAGVKGRADGPCLGAYTYAKRSDGPEDLACLAMLYPVRVKSLEDKYPEAGQRKRRWVSRKKAAKLVKEPELARLILGFKPHRPKARA